MARGSRKQRSGAPAPRRRAAVAPAGWSERRNAVEEKPPPPITKRGNRTRELLKEAAARVLERVGYRAMRLADIAAEADVNVSLVYHYFSGKADITHEILTELIEKQIAQEALTRPHGDDAFDRIVTANLVTVEAYAKTPGLMRCLLQLDEDAPEFSKLYRKVSFEWNQRILRDLARRCPDSTLSESQLLMVVYSLGSMVDGFLFEMYVDRNPRMLESFKDTHEVALFLGVLWYRQIYLRNPPAQKLGRFQGFAGLH